MAGKGGSQPSGGRVALAVLAAAAVALAAVSAWMAVSLADVRFDAERADRATGRQLAAAVERANSLETTAREQSMRIGGLEARATGQPDPAETAAAVRRSVYTVSSGEGGPGGGLGSGFVFASADGIAIIVTSYNIVANQWRAKIRASTILRGDESYLGIVEEVNEADNLAVIRLTTKLPALTAAEGTPKIGDKLLVVADPSGPKETLSQAVVSAVRSDGGFDYPQFSTPIGIGDTGGAVVDRDGRVVGIAMAQSVVTRIKGGRSPVVPIARVCEDFAFC